MRQSYATLLERAQRASGSLAALGLRPGDTVLLQIDTATEFFTIFWGCIVAGIVPVPLGAPSMSDSERAVISRLRAARDVLGRRTILTNASRMPTLRALSSGDDTSHDDIVDIESLAEGTPAPRVDPSPDATAVVLLTSGTGGSAKAVPLSHRNVLAYALGTAQHNGFTDADVSLNWMPLDHVGGLVMFHVRDVVLRCQHIHVPTEIIVRSPLRWLDLLHHYRATLTWAPNFAFALVNQQAASMTGRAWDLSCVRFILNGGEPIVRAVASRFLELLSPFGLPATAMHPAWGMSETSSGVTYSDRFRAGRNGREGPVEVGVPIPGVAIRIVNAAGVVLGEDEIGELQVRGSPVMAGYFHNHGIDRSSLTDEGWFETGDLGKLQGGRLTVVGRSKDVIIIRGVNHSSHDIEALVEEVPGVEPSFTAACAVRRPGDATDRLALFLGTKLARSDEREQLVRRIQATLAESGIVADHFVFLEPERIPKTSGGKIRRIALREQFEQGAFTHEEWRSERPARRPVFHRRVWRRATRRSPRPLGEGPWLVYTDDAGLGEELARHLRSRNRACVLVAAGTSFARPEAHRFVVDPFHVDDYVRLHAILEDEGLAPRHTVNAWAYDMPHGSLADAEFSRRQELSTLGLLFDAQARARSRGAANPESLWVITSRAFEVREGEGVDCEKAMLTGLAKTLQQECPGLSCTQIDLAGTDLGDDLHAVQSELTGDRDRPEVAYRDGQRWHALLAAVEPDDESTTSLLVPGGCYVVSGGLGGIGSEVVKSLLTRYRAHVLVLGRSSTRSVEECVRRLRRAGDDLRYVAADIADAPAVDAAIEAAEEHWGRPLNGIFHLAGVSSARPLLEEAPATVAAGLRAKVGGARVLHRWIERRPEAFVVHFSSVLAVFGGALAGIDAAGNAFLVGLAHAERALGLRSHCLLWSQWQNTGMSRGTGLEAALRGRGYRALTREQGLASLWSALGIDRPHLLIGLDEQNVHVRPHLATPPHSSPRADRRQIVPRNDMERVLTRVWCEILGVESVSVDDNFFEIGGDSLMAVRVVAALEETLGKRVPMTALFRAPRLQQLAAVLEDDVDRAGWCESVPLRSGAGGAPLFCIAGAGEEANVFEPLAAALPPGPAVVGLHILGLDAGEPQVSSASIEDVGRRLVDAIRSRQPRGPYSIGGHCLGGLFAYEAAQQLRARGDDVALLFLIDTIVSDSLPIHRRAPLRIRLEAHQHQLSTRSAWGKVQYIVQKLARHPAEVRLRRRLHRALAPIEEMHRRYRMRPYPGRLILFFASDSYLDRNPSRDPRRRWGRWALDGADIVTVPGHHESMLREPCVVDLARQLASKFEGPRP